MATRKIIKIDEELCNGCGECIISCAEGALKIVDGKAKLIADRYCDGLGACLGGCPTGALQIIERDADEFDEAEVEKMLAAQGKSLPKPGGHVESKPATKPLLNGQMPCGCPSSNMQVFQPKPKASPCASANVPTVQTGSTLGHWPVQVRLIPPHAPFLKNADILVAADCAAPAYPGFHSEFLPGKTLLIGCPKFDDAQDYIERFTKIFAHNDIKSITVLAMEVPCCSALARIVAAGRAAAGRTDVPMEEVIISRDGRVIDRIKG